MGKVIKTIQSPSRVQNYFCLDSFFNWIVLTWVDSQGCFPRKSLDDTAEMEMEIMKSAALSCLGSAITPALSWPGSTITPVIPCLGSTITPALSWLGSTIAPAHPHCTGAQKIRIIYKSIVVIRQIYPLNNKCFFLSFFLEHVFGNIFYFII